MVVEYTLALRDASLSRVMLLDDFVELSVVLRFNDAGAFDVTVPASVVGLLTDGAGLIVERDGAPLLSGTIDATQRTWARDADHLILSGSDDTGLLARRVTLPVPLAVPVPAGTTYSASVADVRTGVAETVMRGYVDANAGPGARSDRMVAGLRLAPDLGRGASGTWRARFEALDDKLREVALGGGDLGFRVVQATDANAVEFQVYATADKTASAVFSPNYGNLRSYEYRQGAPKATYLYVLGQGEGTARTIVEGGDSAARVRWGQREEVVDARGTPTTEELRLRLSKDLGELAANASLTVNPVDLAGMAFGLDYGLGDRVTVMVDGVAVSEVVREVKITLDKQGETVQPALLTPGAVSDPVERLYTAIRALGTRLSRLEGR